MLAGSFGGVLLAILIISNVLLAKVWKYAEMIKEAIYGPVNEKRAWASEWIMTNSRPLLDIVSHLLDQSQMEAGMLALHVRPFRRVDSTATRSYGGFGLGLSIVRQLGELMEEQVVITSNVGEGSGFTITLPLVQAE